MTPHHYSGPALEPTDLDLSTGPGDPSGSSGWLWRFRPTWGDETGAQTAEYGIVTLAAVGFAGLLAVILSGGDVQGMLTDLIKGALSLD